MIGYDNSQYNMEKEKCNLCRGLPAESFASQVGNADDNNYLPVIVDKFEVIEDDYRGTKKLRCAECGAMFMLIEKYEYFVNGASETEQTLTRL